MSPMAYFSDESNLIKAREAVKDRGIFLLENAYPEEFCSQIIQFMDKAALEGQEIAPKTRFEFNYGGTELRIWDAQKQAGLLDVYYDDSNLIMSQFLQRQQKAFTLLAIKNLPLQHQFDVLNKGRWHLDSFKRQLKIFLFLSETNLQSGPFEFLPGTHRAGFKFRNLLLGKYIKPADFAREGKRAYQQLEDSWVDQLSTRGYASQPLICKAGTIAIVDTSAIHRAKPCLEGARYALTSYFR